MSNRLREWIIQHPSLLKRLQGAIRVLAVRRWTGIWLNWMYARLPEARKGDFHVLFSKIFRNQSVPAMFGGWNLKFAGRKLVMPLTRDRIWLDWDSAVSVLGHDVEVKQTYAFLLKSPKPPQLFVDVGANYGTHSLLFLVHGIESISVEPNPSCHHVFREICAVNGVNPRIEGVALGEVDGWTELCFPANETWLGSTDCDVRRKLRARHDLNPDAFKRR